MPLILGILLLKVVFIFYGKPPSQLPENNPPLLSLTALKKQYNPDLFYRIHALDLEHLGDLNGERRSLSTYDPQDLQRWFKVIDALTPTPDLLPFLVTFYYGNARTLRPLCINFLEQHCEHNPQKKWRWLAHGLALSQCPKQSFKIAKKLSSYGQQYNLPLWVKDAEARYRQTQGYHQEARALFQAILNDPHNHLSPEEKLFLQEILELNS